MEPTRPDVWDDVEGLPPLSGEFRSPTIDTLERARERSARARWYAVAALAAVVGAIATQLIYRSTGAYYPFISGLAMLCAVGGGFGPALVAGVGSLVAALLMPPSLSMFPTERFEVIRLAANSILLLAASVLAGMYRRSRLATFEREAKLERAAAGVREVLEGASDAMLLLDAQMCFTYVNRSGTEIFGYAPRALIGRPVTTVMTPETLAALPIQMERLRAGGRVMTERTAYHADGRVLDVEVSARFLSGGRLLASVRDITERKRALERQRTERDLLNGILATSIAGVVVAEPNGAIIFANHRAESLLELRKETPDARAYDRPAWRQALLDGGRLLREEQPLRRIVSTGLPLFDQRVAIIWPDGRRVAISLNGAPLRDTDGNLQAVVFAVNDVTDALAAEAALRERDRRLEEVTQAMPGMVYQYVLNADGTDRFVYVSQYSVQLTGMPPEEVLKSTAAIWTMIHPDDVAPTRASVVASYRAMRPWIHEFRFRDVHQATAWRWISGRAVPRSGTDAGSVLWNGVFVDITDRKLLEDDLRQAQRIESVGRLAGGIAHDFNNLLTVILGQAELLSMDRTLSAEQMAGVSQIQAAAESGSGLTRQLLGFARRQLVAPQVIDVNALALRLPPLMGRLLGERVTLSLHLMETAARVRVDPAQFDQVLVNLAVNARDAMPGGGRVEISTRRIDVDDPARADFPMLADGALVEVAVRDSGSGMTGDVRDRAFEPFFTTKGLGKGTGLGLATSYGIVTQAGGTIVLDSVVGQGTTVRILLPVTEDSLTPREAEASPSKGAGSETILVVDDDFAVRGVTAAALRRYGYHVIEAASGAEALSRSRAEPLPIQALVSDVVMPMMTGPELAEQLRRERPDIRVLFVSGYAEGALSQQGVLPPGVALLQKPYDISELARRVRELLEAAP